MIELEINGIRYEVSAEAEAGIRIDGGERWWGTRVKFRRLNIADKRWTKFLLLDVHSFDQQSVRDGLLAFMERPR